MGNTIWVDVEGRGKEELPNDSSIMLRLKDELDRLADKLGVTKLSQFHDYSVLASEHSDLLEDAHLMNNVEQAAGWNEIKGAWFEPASALVSVRAIYDHLTQHPENLGFTADQRRNHWPSALMEELKHCHATLETAASRGRKFRFLIVS
ncbi:MAG TPA: hypothetical protein VK699_10410 [Terriglobales bacterium]|jgi:hypothetical protein|nr:hypothetical protein [Terriglobales bacterium]